MNWHGHRSITLPWLTAWIVTLAGGLYLLISLWSVFKTALDIIIVLFMGWLISAVIRRFALLVQAKTGLSFRLVALSSFLSLVILVTGSLIALLPLAISQAGSLAKQIPDLISETPPFLDTLQSIADDLGLDVNVTQAYQENFRDQISTTLGNWVSNNALSIAQTTAGGLVKAVFVLGLTVYLILDWERLRSATRRITPESWHEGLFNLYEQFESIFLRWLVGIVSIAILFGGATFGVMTVFGVPYSLPMSFLAGGLVVLPYVGDVFAILLPAFLGAVDKSFGTGVIIAVVLAFYDSVILNILISPRIMGSAVKLPAALVLISVIVSSKVLGPMGAIVGVPVGGFVYFLALASADFAKGRTHVFAEATDEDGIALGEDIDDVDPDNLDPK